MDALWQDLRLAIRKLAGRPAHTGLMIATLALGIGASTAVFSVVDQTILRPPPFIHADRLVDVLDTNRKTGGGGNQFVADKIIGWQAQPEVFERFEAFAPRGFDLTGGTEPERIRGLMVSLGLFEMLGVHPRLGRGFAEGDGRPGAEPVVIISEGLWRRRFDGDADAIGRTLALNDREHTIVGVMPRRFMLLRDEAVWVPFDVKAHQGSSVEGAFYGLGRLRSGLTAASAQPLADRIADNMQQVQPIARTWGVHITARAIARVDPASRRALLVLLGAVAFLLLITCANVANLFLTRAAARHREMAIRSALGAGRARLIRGVLAEGLLLAASGGILGVVLAHWGIGAIVALAPATLRFMTTSAIELDARVLGVAAASTGLIGLLFALLPALRGSRPDVEATLRSSGNPSAAKFSYARVPGGLVIAEVGLSVVLLVGAALMIRTLANLESIDPGFERAGLISMQVALPTDRYFGGPAHARFFDDLAERIRALPGVTDVALSLSPPPAVGGITFGRPETDAGPIPAVEQPLVIPNGPVSANFFRTLQIPIVAGRTFISGDTADVAIVSQAIAELFWPGDHAIGKRFRLGSNMPWVTVIGVAGDIDARASGDERTSLAIYQPWVVRPLPAGAKPPPRRGYSSRTVIVRAAHPASVVPALKAAVYAIDPKQPVEEIVLAEDLYLRTFARERFVLALMGVFAGVALALTAAGIFAVLSQVVAQRTREIGIRVALGARPADVFSLVISRGMLLTVCGIAVGLAGAFALTRLLRTLMYEVSPYDPVSFALVALLLAVVALLACWIPTRTAMKVHPAVALRVE